MSQLEDLLQQCTVQLSVPKQVGWGTGFFVGPEWILTCAHVVQAAKERSVQVRWQGREWEAVVEQLLPHPYDLALLRVTLPTNVNPACVCLGEEIRSRDPLYLFGYPDQDFPNGCPVTLSCEGLTGDDPALIKFALGQVRPGMSGAPLLNQRTGKVCGIVKFTRDRSIDLGGGAISARAVLEQFPQLRELQQEFHGSDRCWINIVAQQTDVNFQAYLQSIIEDEGYREWQDLYTPTMVEDKRRLPKQENAQLPQRRVSARLKLRVEMEKVTKEQLGVRDADESEPQNHVEQLGVLEGLRQYAADHVLLIGKPGSGKSTSLERFLWEEADSALKNLDGRIPVLVKLRRCTGTVEDLIRDFLSHHQLVLDVANIEELLWQGKFLLLLDGLNELPEVFRTNIANFRDRYRRTTPMIISTRDLGMGGTLGIEKMLKMLPLTELQMQEFVQGYLGSKGERLLQQVQGDRLQKFAETPLLLWMLCRVFAQSGRVPTNLGLAFREFSQLHDHNIQQDAPTDSRDQWHKLLRHLAFSLIRGKTFTDFRLSMSREEVENQLTDCLQQEGRANPRDCAERWLKDLLKYHLIQPVIQPNLEEHIEFRHQLIQEYYAAEYLLRILPDLSDEVLEQNYLNYLKWTEPFALMLGLANEENFALKVVRLAMNVDWMLGARLAGEVSYHLQSQTVDLIENSAIPLKFKVQLFGFTRSIDTLPFLSQLLDNSEPFVRGESIRAIGRVGGEKSIALLRRAINDQDKNNSWMAACELASIGDEVAIPALQEALHDDKHHTNALFYIERFFPERVISSLYKIFKDGNSKARLKATTSLHLIMKKSCEEILPLLEIALHDQDNQVRRAAAHALMDSHSDEAISILSQAWADEDISVRNFVCVALEKSVEKYLENSLEKALLGSNTSLCKYAIEIVLRTKLGSENIIKLLLRVAFYNTDFLIRNSADVALIRIGNSYLINALSEILEEDEFEIRSYQSNHSLSIGLLLQIRSIESIPILVKVLADRDKNIVVRKFAIKALGEIGEPSVIQALVNNLDISISEGDWALEDIYLETVLALGKLGVQSLEDEIISIAKSSVDSNTRKEAVEVLGTVPTEKAHNSLLELLADPDFSVRFSSALILANQKNTNSIPVLIGALGKRSSVGFEDSAVCRNAIDALCKIGEEALEELGYALDDQDFQLQRNARLAISSINGEGSQTDQLNVLTDKSTDDYIDNIINSLTSKYSFVELTHALSIVSSDEAWQFCTALRRLSQPEKINFLNEFMLNSDSNNIFQYVPTLISSIQTDCKFYNYEIWHESIEQEILMEEPAPFLPKELLTRIDQIDQRTQQMANEPKNNFSGANFNAPVNFGNNPTGDFIATQNNYTTDPEVQSAIVELQVILTQLQTQHPRVTSETQAIAIIDAEFTEIKQSQTHRLVTLRKQLLNPERHLQAIKAALGEVMKHCLEESVWVKAGLTYFDKLSEKPNHGA